MRHCISKSETKQSLISAPILPYPTRNGRFVLDASNSGIGAFLSQIQNGEERVIAYASKTFPFSTKLRYNLPRITCCSHFCETFQILPQWKKTFLSARIIRP